MNKIDDMRRVGTRQVRAVPQDLKTREMGEERSIEGYFAVFDSDYEIGPGMTESVAPGAFSKTISGDVRALVNHDTTLVLGRTTANTLTLSEDSHGLWGRVRINPNDQAALDLYARVQRGDVDGCSFGFDIIDEETEFREDGDVHWTIREVELYEVSCCTFPAYEETNIEARSRDKAEAERRKTDIWKENMKRRLKHGTTSPDEA